ncbi:MAG: ABC transporter permease [Anaerovoracaceae bacterium]|jgi:spermidine/putrescine transport system permease protein
MYRKMAALPFVFWLICGTVLPLMLIIYYGFTDMNGNFTLYNIKSIAMPVHLKATAMALLFSLAATAVCLALAFPLALILRKLGRAGSVIMTFIFVMPMWINSLLRIQAWQVILEKNGLFDNIFSALGIAYTPLINTPAAVIIGMVYDFFPFMVLPVYNSMIKIDSSLLEAAADLGASGPTIIRRVILPLTGEGIASGITMVFVPSLTTFAISDLLGGGKIYLIGNVIEQEFTTSADWNLGSGLSLVMMVFILISMALVSVFSRDERRNVNGRKA